MLIKLKSATNIGIETISIDVEVNICVGGLPKFNIVGLPSKAVEESKQRVVTALFNSGVSFPRKRITVNLAPADIPKEGSIYDLPISVGILSAILKVDIPPKSVFYGELSLDGSLRHSKGVFLLALFAQELGYENLFIPTSTINEASCINDINIYPVNNIREIISHLKGDRTIIPIKGDEHKALACDDEHKASMPATVLACGETDFSEIIDNQFAKRAMEIVAAGGHNILMTGSPGSGKTMLARALSGILPALSKEEAIEVTKIYSATGNIPPNGSIMINRPFRAPHHTTSTIGLIGGGSKPQPGEISLAHRGVLFLDELAEFPQYTLDTLRQPIEDRIVTISRSKGRVTFPADFILVAATNPCPCGNFGHKQKQCTCSPNEISRYNKKISGPLLDRIDLCVRVDPIPIDKLKLFSNINKIICETSTDILHRVEHAREIQLNRFKETKIRTNSEMHNSDIKKFVKISQKASTMLYKFVDKYQFSTRTFFRLIKVAQTIADLEDISEIMEEHILEAIQYKISDYQHAN